MIKESQTLFALIMVGVLIYIIYKQKEVFQDKLNMGKELMGSMVKMEK